MVIIPVALVTVWVSGSVAVIITVSIAFWPLIVSAPKAISAPVTAGIIIPVVEASTVPEDTNVVSSVNVLVDVSVWVTPEVSIEIVDISDVSFIISPIIKSFSAWSSSAFINVLILVSKLFALNDFLSPSIVIITLSKSCLCVCSSYLLLMNSRATDACFLFNVSPMGPKTVISACELCPPVVNDPPAVILRPDSPALSPHETTATMGATTAAIAPSPSNNFFIYFSFPSLWLYINIIRHLA